MEGAQKLQEGLPEKKDVGLKELSRKLQLFAEERDWEKYHTPRNLLLAMVLIDGHSIGYRWALELTHIGKNLLQMDFLPPILVFKCILSVVLQYPILLPAVGEVGELSEIFMWRGEVERGLASWKESDKEHLGEELSDVLLYLIRLSDICGIDLGDAANKKIVKNSIKYPASKIL